MGRDTHASRGVIEEVVAERGDLEPGIERGAHGVAHTIPGFSAKPDYSGGHDDGPTSVDEGRGFLFVTDRTSRKLLVVDPKASRIVASTDVAAGRRICQGQTLAPRSVRGHERRPLRGVGRRSSRVGV